MLLVQRRTHPMSDFSIYCSDSCFSTPQSAFFTHYRKLVDGGSRVVPQRPTRKSTFPVCIRLIPSKIIHSFSDFSPHRKSRPRSTTNTPTNHHRQSFFKDSGSRQREAAGSDRKFGMVGGQYAASGHWKQKTTYPALEPLELRLSLLPSSLRHSQFAPAERCNRSHSFFCSGSL
jgi:hypothetical protein